jgi:hypothetical protein
VQHCTPELLALAALREPLSPDDATHLESCAQCRAEVASLQRGVDALAVPQLAAPTVSVTPPAGVWASIAAATGVSTSPRADAGGAVPPTVRVAAPPVATQPAAPVPVEQHPPAGGTVRVIRPRRSRLLLAVAAALAGAVIGAGAVAVLRGGDGEDGVPVAAVDLDPLEGERASGRASVVEREDGSRVLTVDLDAPSLDDGYYEVWLIEPAIEDMVPVGVAVSGRQDFVLPEGLDVGEFPIVDVSVEPLDGDPTHSGVSVARGQLES